MMEEEKHAVLLTDGLSVGYGDTAVVRQIFLQAAAGEILCLIGINGAGKSTVLKTLVRELAPLEGAILLENLPLQSIKDKTLARKSAAVLTGRVEPELMTCEELVGTGRYPYTGLLGVLSPDDRCVVDEIIELVGIGAIRHCFVSQVSDGQRQRVMLARALCQEPKLLVMDEPVSYLDIRHKLEFLSLIRRLTREKQIAVIISLHELDLAQKFCDRILCVGDGRVLLSGTPEEIFTGDTIQRLYSVEHGSYDCLFGSVEAERNTAPPRVFVIGGSGRGIPIYRQLSRRKIPFAAGVIPENDLDLPVARALASVLFTDRANEPVSAEQVDLALDTLKNCETVLCPLPDFGSVNRENRRLLEYAEKAGLLRQFFS